LVDAWRFPNGWVSIRERKVNAAAVGDVVRNRISVTAPRGRQKRSAVTSLYYGHADKPAEDGLLTLQGLREIRFGKWREIDSLRFWALRLDDVGAIKSSPQQIIAQGVDLRFLNELKRELKA
jgi:hypothetical protein